MKVWFAVFAATLGLSACNSNTESTDVDEGMEQEASNLPDIPVENIEAHIRFLASDLLGGRDTGAPGYEIAANYVATQYRLMGLEPAGDDGGYFAQVPLQSLLPDGDAARFVLGDGETVQEFTHAETVFLAAHPVLDSSTVTADVVFVGFGVSAPQHGYDDYANVDVDGRIVAFVNGAPGVMPSDERSHHQRENTKRALAAEHGAIGYIILLNAPAENLTGLYNVAMTDPTVQIGPDASEPAYSQLQVKATSSLELSQALFTNADASFEDAIGRLQNNESASMPLNVSVTMSQGTNRETFNNPNVVAMLPGSDPALVNEIVVLSAHLDHIGTDTIDGPMNTGSCRSNDEEDRICNGAVDNASGVSIMLETARTFTQVGAPRRSLLFVALVGEEQGLLGSEYFANNPTVARERMVANVNLDMPVIVYDFSDVIAFGGERSTIGPIATRAAAQLNVTISEDPLPEQNLFVRSDHYNFVQQGIPSVFLMTGFSSPDPRWDEGEGFMGFLQNHYHRHTDEPDGEELEILYDQGAKFANINYMIAREIANNDEAPQWNEGDFFGDFFGDDR